MSIRKIQLSGGEVAELFCDYGADGEPPSTTFSLVGGDSLEVTLAAAQQNLSVGDAVARVLMTPAAGGSTLGGMRAPAKDDSIRFLTNESTTDPVEVVNEDPGSTQTWRFTCVPGTTLPPRGTAIARYVKTRWRIL